ncbi:hypothetical protein [Hoeflea prorocentri]|uniref:Uncharacterized protein n=1 Tax=Hoeflea prorocentri TaxID=1922333 RepID=A0A9X3ZGY7_9HYPH|nr:hypothetical protein [Hoeflea prorocentri]MCY6380235.1 hypothetical protein [Hoeflea prorocentri]MDA5398035.1 hypothetical protein [Hoeflea prorocentri]
MTTEKIRSASEVLSDFIDDQAKDEALDQASVSAISKLRGESKLTRTNLLRQLEGARRAVLKGDCPQQEN